MGREMWFEEANGAAGTGGSEGEKEGGDGGNKKNIIYKLELSYVNNPKLVMKIRIRYL